MKVITHLQLVQRLRMRGAILPLANTSLWLDAKLSNRYVFVAWYLVKLRDYFTFTFLFREGKYISGITQFRASVRSLKISEPINVFNETW
jgi:hypothetical protein